MVTQLPHVDEVFEGDCRVLLATLPDASVDLVISSPPYNIGKEYESRRALDEYLAAQTEVLRECVRVLRRTGSIFWQVGSFTDKGAVIPLDVRFFPILEELGAIPRNRIVWARTHGLHATRRFSGRHETILWFSKSDDYLFSLDEVRVPQKYPNKKAYRGPRKGEETSHPDGKNPGDVWAFRNVKHNHEEQTIHPAQFPEDLVGRIVRAASEPGGIVLDPYLGAGTVAVVARELGRHFVGAEIDPRYVAIARRRLAREPDETGAFPNLRTLREYAEGTGTPPGRYRFDVQVGREPTGATKSRIYDEAIHRAELVARLEWEASAHAARSAGKTVPTFETLLQTRRAAPASEPMFPENLSDHNGTAAVEDAGRADDGGGAANGRRGA